MAAFKQRLSPDKDRIQYRDLMIGTLKLSNFLLLDSTTTSAVSPVLIASYLLSKRGYYLSATVHRIDTPWKTISRCIERNCHCSSCHLKCTLQSGRKPKDKLHAHR